MPHDKQIRAFLEDRLGPVEALRARRAIRAAWRVLYPDPRSPASAINMSWLVAGVVQAACPTTIKAEISGRTILRVIEGGR